MGGGAEKQILLARLASAWQEAHPRKAAGGSNALAGFGFQIDLALQQMLDDWESLGPAEREVPTTFAEHLSDVVTAKMEEPLQVVQAKLTLSSPAVRKGLDDLFSVYEVARSVVPEDVDGIGFALAFRTGDPGEAQPVVERWADEDRQARGRFAAKVEVRVEPDPGAEFVSRLLNRFKAEDAAALHSQWVGDLIAAAAYPVAEERPAELRATSRAICRKLAELERSAQRHGGIHFLSAEDRPPEKVERGEVLTGQQPTIGHLRQGFFAERPEVAQRLKQSFVRWADEREGPQGRSAVPVFWIGGRSGSGKSITLIQLLVALRQEGWDPILWLRNKNKLLPEAGRLTREGLSQERPPLIGIDDPYAPALSRNETWDAFLTELGIGMGEEGRLPLVVCCGPTEQAEMLKRDFPDDLEVEIVELEREQPEDLDRLREWYELRTGASAPAPTDENLLLVQLFFEWRTGEALGSFAERFKHRIEDADDADAVVPLLAETLALNRLYVGFPVAAARRRLSDRQADLLARLRREEHIEIADDDARTGLWLAHPHLANGIYETWFPVDSTQNERSGHFRRAALASLKEGADTAERMAPVQAVALGLTTDVAAIRDRLDPSVVEELPAIYDEAQTLHKGRPPIDELVLWVEVEMASGADFDPDPVDEALLLITPQACRLPATARLCEVLLKNVDQLAPSQERDLMDIVLHLLEKEPRWADWARVASAALKARRSKRLSRIISEWAEGNSHLGPEGWALVGSVKDEDEGTRRLRSQGVRLLRDYPQHPSWGRTWTALWKQQQGEGLVRMALEHLESRPRDPSWSFIWIALADAFSTPRRKPSALEVEVEERLPEVARNWLRGNIDHRGWSTVWSRLWRWRPSSHLVPLGRRWLQRNDPLHRTFSFVWTELWKLAGPDPDLRDQGLDALNRIDFDQSEWGRIFIALHEVDPSPELRAIGLRWIRAASPHGRAWGYVLPALWKATSAEEDKELLEELERAALGFLQEASPNHVGWSYVFTGVEGSAAEAELREIGLRWLDEVPHRHPGWTWTWKKLLGRAESGMADAAEHHRQLGEDWLRDRFLRDDRWSYMFLALWPYRPTAELRELGRRWLRRTDSSYPGWVFVWRALWLGADRWGDGMELRRRAVAWLRLQPDNKQWPLVWQFLWDRSGDQELRGIGERWLNGRGQVHTRRGHVVSRLKAAESAEDKTASIWFSNMNALAGRFSRYPSDFNLCELYERLQEEVPPQCYGNQLIWAGLWRRLWRKVRTREVREAALRWLELPLPSGRHGRSYVWKPLWYEERCERLYRVGCDYLASAPPARSLWSSMWFELWGFQPSDELRSLGEAWLEAGVGNVKEAEKMRSRLSEPLVPIS